MHDRVIPRGHHLAVLFLARIPGRRDVCVCTLKDDECVNLWREIFPRRVGTREVPAQSSKRGGLRINLERDVIGIEPARSEHDQRAEWMRTNQIVHHIDTWFSKVARQVHASFSVSSL